jgi:hypothetical protein
MTNENALKLLQDWTNKIPLIVLGSGASVPFNIPGMWHLGEYLKNNISFEDATNQKQFNEFRIHFDQHNDLEKTLLHIQVSEAISKEIVLKTWELINKHDLEAYLKVISENYEFPLSNLIKYLLKAASKKVSIITTNYDRIAEYAASIAGGFICTGFSQNFVGLFSNSIHNNNFSKINGYNGQVNIWKVHGSLDWFRTKNEKYIQLPLRTEVPDNFIPSIVTPGINKYYQTHNEPYRTIFTQSDNEIDNASGYLCIGYGFNDEHVQPKLINQIKNNKPIIVITKQLSENTKNLIINNNCKNYILMEEDENSSNTKVYTSKFGDFTEANVSYWQLSEFLKLII